MPETVALCRDDRIEINPMYLLRWEETQNAHVLLYPEGIIKLNQTAGEILSECAPGVSVGDVVDSLSRRYAGDEVAGGVMRFLEVSHAKGWIRRQP